MKQVMNLHLFFVFFILIIEKRIITVEHFVVVLLFVGPP